MQQHLFSTANGFPTASSLTLLPHQQALDHHTGRRVLVVYVQPKQLVSIADKLKCLQVLLRLEGELHFTTGL
jgi:hypothetical protein